MRKKFALALWLATPSILASSEIATKAKLDTENVSLIELVSRAYQGSTRLEMETSIESAEGCMDIVTTMGRSSFVSTIYTPSATLIVSLFDGVVTEQRLGLKPDEAEKMLLESKVWFEEELIQYGRRFVSPEYTVMPYSHDWKWAQAVYPANWSHGTSSVVLWPGIDTCRSGAWLSTWLNGGEDITRRLEEGVIKKSCAVSGCDASWSASTSFVDDDGYCRRDIRCFNADGFLIHWNTYESEDNEPLTLTVSREIAIKKVERKNDDVKSVMGSKLLGPNRTANDQ